MPLARKKSKGSKKARSRKKAKKPVQAEASTSAEATADLEAPPEPVSTPTEEKATKKPASGAKTSKKKAEDGDSEDPPSKKETTARKTPTKKKATSKQKGDAADADSPPPKKKAASGKKKPARKKAVSAKKEPESTPELEVLDVPEELEELAVLEAPAPEEAPIVLDDVDDDLEDLVAAAASLDDEIVTVAIDPDDDLNDPEARERLIAEALAFVAEEEGGEAPATESASPPPATDAGEAGEAQPPAASTDDASEAATEDDDRPADTLQMTAQALLALSEIHAEGMASLPGELVLDLGEATTADERDRLLAAALAQVEMQDAVYRVRSGESRSRRIKTGIAAGIFLIAGVVGVSPPGILVPDPPQALTPADRIQGVRIALLLQAQQVEAFRVEAGRLPNSMAEVDAQLPGIRLVKSSNRLYQLIAYTSDGEPVVYDSEVPAPEFERLRRSWSTTRDGS